MRKGIAAIVIIMTIVISSISVYAVLDTNPKSPVIPTQIMVER